MLKLFKSIYYGSVVSSIRTQYFLNQLYPCFSFCAITLSRIQSVPGEYFINEMYLGYKILQFNLLRISYNLELIRCNFNVFSSCVCCLECYYYPTKFYHDCWIMPFVFYFQETDNGPYWLDHSPHLFNILSFFNIVCYRPGMCQITTWRPMFICQSDLGHYMQPSATWRNMRLCAIWRPCAKVLLLAPEAA